jgi:V/A-type H+-transporting ATPase subunit D
VAKLEMPPTKSSLLTLQGNLAFAQEGFDLLEQKRQVLIYELMSRLEAAKRAQQAVDEAMAAALDALREDALRSGTDALHRESLGIVRDHQLDVRSRSVMGIAVPDIDASHQAPRPEFSPASGSALSDEVMRRFTAALDAVAELAEIENAVLRLASEVRRTQRRVNALEKIFIPDYQDTIAYIDGVLEEREREQFAIMKMAKRKRRDD